jgi:hypothetical protein
LMQLIQALTDGLAALRPEEAPVGAPHPKISVKIPIYRASPEENVMTWMLQCLNIFQTQGIVNEQTHIGYVAIGFEGAVLHWYLNKVQAAQAEDQEHVFVSWNEFATALRTSFQPPNFQQHLRQQLKKLKQTGSVQDYGMQFRNILGQIDDMAEPDKVAYFTEGLKPAT